MFLFLEVLVYFRCFFMDMSWYGMYVRGGRQEYHDPVQKVHQLESVESSSRCIIIKFVRGSSLLETNL